ncbi:MAG: M23 family metallopeptidase, partial [Candidatus Tectomicrobia bacterium]|nr:M23 family metallopeptidase [Candidatus Tectomicrobia bacterium]
GGWSGGGGNAGEEIKDCGDHPIVVDTGSFQAITLTLSDKRQVTIPSETVALYRMIVSEGKIRGKEGPEEVNEAEQEEAISLRRFHEGIWAKRFHGEVTPENSSRFPVENGALPSVSGYHEGHRAEDLFAKNGSRVFAPATMLILHAGYLSKTAGETVIGFILPDGQGGEARYILLVHIDAAAGRPFVGCTMKAGTVVGHVTNREELKSGNATGKAPHVHFVIREEKEDGSLQGIEVYEFLRKMKRASP